jgi:hypothetical protein
MNELRADELDREAAALEERAEAAADNHDAWSANALFADAWSARKEAIALRAQVNEPKV